MKESIYRVFGEVEQAQRALGALLDRGAEEHDISLIIKEPHAGRYSADTTESTDARTAAVEGITTTTTGDAMAGAAKGAGIGLGVGALAALAAVAVPGFGLVIGGGALAAALAGAAGTTAAGAVAGGVTGYLADQGIEDEEIARYVDSFERGAAVLNVSVPSGKVDAATARSILDKYRTDTDVDSKKDQTHSTFS